MVTTDWPYYYVFMIGIAFKLRFLCWQPEAARDVKLQSNPATDSLGMSQPTHEWAKGGERSREIYLVKAY